LFPPRRSIAQRARNPPFVVALRHPAVARRHFYSIGGEDDRNQNMLRAPPPAASGMPRMRMRGSAALLS
jgi:hypothetical protein